MHASSSLELVNAKQTNNPANRIHGPRGDDQTKETHYAQHTPAQTPACDARVHYPDIKQQEANQHPPLHQEKQRLMPQTPNSMPCTNIDVFH
jgi:hypothetical protein